jgi:hypothetical protein
MTVNLGDDVALFEQRGFPPHLKKSDTHHNHAKIKVKEETAVPLGCRYRQVAFANT